jgi:hypothetical protein
MDAATLFKVGHALLGIWVVAILVGRWMTLAQAARSTELAAVHTLLRLSDGFERQVRVIPPFVLIVGIATAIAQGRPFLGPLQGEAADWLFVSTLLFLSIIPVIPLVFLPRGRIFSSALAEADVQGAVTPALTAAFRDRVVFAAHVYELAVILVIFVLMLTKPF